MENEFQRVIDFCLAPKHRTPTRNVEKPVYLPERFANASYPLKEKAAPTRNRS